VSLTGRVFMRRVSAEHVAQSVDALLWLATAMSGTALQLMLVLLLLLSCTSHHLLRHQQLVVGLGAACFHAAAGPNYDFTRPGRIAAAALA